MMNDLSIHHQTVLPEISKALNRVLLDGASGGWVTSRFPPLEFTEATRGEAEQTLRVVESLLKPAPRETVEKWLATLGVLVAGKTPIDEARVRIAAFASLLEFPEQCYTQDTLRSAGKRFTWFPSFAEVNELLAEVIDSERSLAFRLRLALKYIPVKSDVAA